MLEKSWGIQFRAGARYEREILFRRQFAEVGLLSGSHCDLSQYELLVAFSCKNRGVCPSCSARRMADTAAHLRDPVFPAVPLRQWVYTMPKRLRFLLAWKPTLISLALTLFLRALFAWQRRCARKQGLKEPLCGAVTFIQRVGSALHVNIHFHTLVPEGVFFQTDQGGVGFHALLPPSVADRSGRGGRADAVSHRVSGQAGSAHPTSPQSSGAVSRRFFAPLQAAAPDRARSRSSA
jgi:hypothetical protein